MKKVWVVNANSESGDDYGPYLFDKKPTDKELETFMKDYWPDEFPEEKDGPGKWGSYLYISLVESEIKTPSKKNKNK